MPKKKVILVFATLLASLTLLSTATAWAHKLDAVASFHVDPSVTVPDKVMFLGSATATGQALSGLAGGLIAASDQDPAKALAELMNQHNIDVGKILYEKVRTGLEKSKSSAKLTDSSTTQFKLSVHDYGISNAGGFSKATHPYMTVQIRVEDANGKVVWKTAAFMSKFTFKKLPLRPAEEWLSHPEYVSAGFSQVAELLTADLLEGL